MGLGEVFVMGLMEGSINRRLDEQNALLREQNDMVSQEKVDELQEQIIAELRRSGKILPEYDWQDNKFIKNIENTLVNFYYRHPEIKRNSGDFQRKYPEKFRAVELLNRLSTARRISPHEYFELHKEIFNF